jgi:predicted component of type VI protein secretion system
MRIDDPKVLTLDAVRKLIASKDDSRHRQLRVSEDGEAYLSDVVGNRNLQGVRFRLETWSARNGYSGKTAAQKDGWVRSVYNTVRKNWESGWKGYVDFKEAA